MRLKVPAGLEEYLERLIEAALSEDVGAGDITTSSIVDPKRRGAAVLIAKEPFVVAGLFAAEQVFKYIDRNVRFMPEAKDGDRVKKGRIIARVSGRLSVLLAGERVALNLLQRLSGIATLTAEFVKKTAGTGVTILDTRKTIPCFRPLERYAVRMGGGENHRFGLFDRVLVKDNHIMAAGSVTEAMARARANLPAGTPIEVEVTNRKELKEALKACAEIILLDNMSVERIKKAVKLVDGRAITEVSGGVNLDTAGLLARTGVDFISVGALTHSARAVDISMKVVSYGSGPAR